MNKYTIALSLSIGLHLLAGAVLFLGNFNSDHKPTPKPVANVQPIKAVAIDKTELANRINELTTEKTKAKNAEKKRIEALEKRAKEAKAKRAKEQARIKTLEKARKQKEQEKLKADKAAKSAKDKANKAEKVRKAKVAEQKKAEKAAASAKARRIAEEKAAQVAADERKRKAAEKKRKEQEAQEQALQEALLAEQLAVEMASRQQARNQQVSTEVNRYNALISQAIDRSVLKDQTTMAGKSCSLIISVTSSGFVTNVTTGDGDSAVCNAAKTGVLKLGSVPMSDNPDVYNQFKRFELVYRPDFGQ